MMGDPPAIKSFNRLDSKLPQGLCPERQNRSNRLLDSAHSLRRFLQALRHSILNQELLSAFRAGAVSKRERCLRRHEENGRLAMRAGDCVLVQLKPDYATGSHFPESDIGRLGYALFFNLI
jgi:hypothetical protein